MRRASYLATSMCIAALGGACAMAPSLSTGYADETSREAGSLPHDARDTDSAADAASRPPEPDASFLDHPDASVPPPDASSTPPPDSGGCARVGPGRACGVAPQCGCSSGETCDLTASGDSQCVGPAGLGVPGNHCVNAAACEVGLTCGYGQSCRPFCTTAGQPCGGANLGTCIQLKGGSGAAIPNFLVCEIKCQLHEPGSCGLGSGCFQSSITAGASDCYSAGSKGYNQVCVYADDCQAGYGCVGVSGGTYRCKKWCRVGQNDCGGATCAGFGTPLVVNNVTYGTCP